MKEFIKKINGLSGKHTIGEVFADFLTLSANTLANTCDWAYLAKREKEYQQIRKKYTDAELTQFSELLAILMQKTQQALHNRELTDFFSQLFMQGFSDGQKGQFFTPFSVSQFMSNMIILSQLDQPIIRQTEMSCGAGAMIIATANTLMKRNINFNQRLLVECGDLDLRCVQMCYIQLFLYGIPATVQHRNGLSGQVYCTYRTADYFFMTLD